MPITAYREGDYKLMRQLNTGEIKLFNLVDDMGETKDLAQAMPEKTAEMVCKLDAYLDKVGAWTMDEVYAARAEELEMWVERGKREIAELELQITTPNLSPTDRKQLQVQLKSVQTNFERHSNNLERQAYLRSSERWM